VLTLVGFALRGLSSSPSFTYSKSPSDLILFVQAAAPSAGNVTSMSLYGDGRLELRLKRWRSGEDKRWDARLTADEVEALMTKAVESGLAEWDRARIAAEQKKLASGIPGSFDGTTVTVVLYLEHYLSGGRSTDNLRKTIEYANPDSAAESFPAIGELRGLTDLWRYLQQALMRPPETRSNEPDHPGSATP
jgi:hypothetical protein